MIFWKLNWNKSFLNEYQLGEKIILETFKKKKKLVDFYSYYILVCITKKSYILILLFIVYIYFCFLILKILDLTGFRLNHSIQWIAIKISFNECLIESNKVIRWYSKSIKRKNYIKPKKLRETNFYKFFEWNNWNICVNST